MEDLDRLMKAIVGLVSVVKIEEVEELEMVQIWLLILFNQPISQRGAGRQLR